MSKRSTRKEPAPVQSPPGRLTVTKGSGITKREVTMLPLNTPDGRPIKESIPNRGSWTFDATVRGVETWARAVLQQAEKDGRGYAWDDDSPESYAARILQRIAMTRDSASNWQAAARWALEVGRLCEQARMKFSWEKPALVGERHIEQQRKFAGQRHKEQQDKHAQWRAWQQTAIDNDKNFACLSKEGQAAELKVRHRIHESADTIRKRLA